MKKIYKTKSAISITELSKDEAVISSPFISVISIFCLLMVICISTLYTIYLLSCIIRTYQPSGKNVFLHKIVISTIVFIWITGGNLALMGMKNTASPKTAKYAAVLAFFVGNLVVSLFFLLRSEELLVTDTSGFSFNSQAEMFEFDEDSVWSLEEDDSQDMSQTEDFSNSFDEDFYQPSILSFELSQFEQNEEEDLDNISVYAESSQSTSINCRQLPTIVKI